MVTTAHWVFDNNAVTRALSEWGDGILAVSPDIRRYLYLEYGVSPLRVKLTVNGVDIKARANGTDVIAPRIVHVSRLDSDRAAAAFALVRVAPALAQSLPGLEILIVGDGDRADELRTHAFDANCKLGRACVKFTGAIRDVNCVLASGGVFVGVSRAALEASACGLPVILAGNEGYTGLLCADNFDRAAKSNFCCRGEANLTADVLCRDIIECFEDQACARAAADYCCGRVVSEYSSERMARDAEEVYIRTAHDVSTARSQKKIMLCGYFGYGNAGDEASLEALTQAIRRAGCREIKVLSAHPRKSSGLVGARAIRRFDIPRIALHMIKDRPLFCLAGGNLLQNSTSERSLLYYSGLARLATMLGCQTALIGGGVGDLYGRHARARAARALEGCSSVIFRTEYDRQIARRLTERHLCASVGCDPAMMLAPTDDNALVDEAWFAPFCGRRFIVFSFVGRTRREEVTSAAVIASLVLSLCCKLDARPLFVAMYPREDESFCRHVHALCAQSIDAAVAPPLSPCELARLFSLAYLAVGERLHSSVMAIAAERPTVLIGGGSKKIAFDSAVSRVARALGLPSPLLRLCEIDSAALPLILPFVSEQSRRGSARAVAERMRLDAEKVTEILCRDE